MGALKKNPLLCPEGGGGAFPSVQTLFSPGVRANAFSALRQSRRIREAWEIGPGVVQVVQSPPKDCLPLPPITNWFKTFGKRLLHLSLIWVSFSGWGLLDSSKSYCVHFVLARQVGHVWRGWASQSFATWLGDCIREVEKGVLVRRLSGSHSI